MNGRKTMINLWRGLALILIFIIVGRVFFAFKPLLLIYDNKISMNWVLEQAMRRYQEEVNSDFTVNDLLSHSWISYSRKYSILGSEEIYSGVLILDVYTGGVFQNIECHWRLENTVSEFEVEKWQKK